MSRKVFIPLFIAFAAMFVPVILYSGIVEFVIPAAWIGAFAGGALLQGKTAQFLWAAGHLAFYVMVFYAGARAAFWLACRSQSSTGRLAIQGVVLLALFLCSFLRVMTYSALQGRGGTYNLWGAVSRCFEKYDSR